MPAIMIIYFTLQNSIVADLRISSDVGIVAYDKAPTSDE